MKSKLYKLAIWYIAKCNAEWNKRKFEDDLKSLDRLTYWNFGKYMLAYGADAEWQNFSRYEVLDNAIQKLAQYENAEQEIRNNTIQEFAERLQENVESFQAEINGFKADILTLDYFFEIIDEIAEELKGGSV